MSRRALPNSYIAIYAQVREYAVPEDGHACQVITTRDQPIMPA